MVLTAGNRWGQILKVQRLDAGYAATLLGPCGIIPCINGRDAVSEAAFAAALKGGDMEEVKSLRRDNTPRTKPAGCIATASACRGTT